MISLQIQPVLQGVVGDGVEDYRPEEDKEDTDSCIHQIGPRGGLSGKEREDNVFQKNRTKLIGILPIIFMTLPSHGYQNQRQCKIKKKKKKKL